MRVTPLRFAENSRPGYVDVNAPGCKCIVYILWESRDRWDSGGEDSVGPSRDESLLVAGVIVNDAYFLFVESDV